MSPTGTDESPARWIDSRPRRVLALLLLFSLFLDLAWLGTHPPSLESGETSHWWPIVLNVAQGRGYTGCFQEYFPFCGPTNQVTAMREPVPVVLFAVVARLTGGSLSAAVALEIALHSGIVIGIFFLARALAGSTAATLAALLWSAYLPALELVLQVSGELAATLGVVWGLFFFVRARRTGRVGDWLAAGFVLGLGALSRSAIVFLIPALVLVEVLQPTVRPRGAWRRVALLASAFVVTMAPWMVRNEAVLGRPSLGTTLGGYNLYRQNVLLPSPDYLRVVAGADSRLAVQDLVARRTDLRGTENEVEMDRVYTREALRLIGIWPLRYLHLSAYRFLSLWFNWGVLEAYGVRLRLRDYLLGAEQLILLVLAIGGLRYLGREAWPLVACVAAYTAAHMLVNGQLRYIVPMMPLAIVSATAVLARVVEFVVVRGARQGGRSAGYRM